MGQEHGYGEPPEYGGDPVPTEKALVPRSALPPIDVDQAIAEWNDYQRLCREILDDNDYAEIRGLKARKRSGWAKLRRFYNISTSITWEERVPPVSEWEPGQAFLYLFTVSGRIGNRIEFADGACESEEMLCSACKGEGCQHCKGTGYSIAPTEHNVRAKALTRALNRLTSNLIGGGEVSAEELENGAPTPAKRSQPSRKAPSKKAAPPQDALELIMIEANAQIEAMELESPYTDKAHTLAGIKACGHTNTTFKYFTENHSQIVAELIDRVVAETTAEQMSGVESYEGEIE